MYSMKLMIVLCLTIAVSGAGIKKKILKNVKAVRSKVDELSKSVANLANTLDYTDQLNNLSNSCGQLSDISEDVSEILAKMETLITQNKQPRSCQDLLEDGYNVSGVYNIYLHKKSPPLRVYCDQETDGGGWLVFQRREDGTEDFYRNWKDYKLGFGNPLGEVWLGLENLYLLTKSGNHELRIDLGDFEGNNTYAKYSNFRVGPMIGNYVLTAENYSGDAGDSMWERHNGSPFSTKDRDHSLPKHCAQSFKGGWWYEACHYANLNGLYKRGNHLSYADGVNWFEWKGYYYSLKFTEMKFR